MPRLLLLLIVALAAGALLVDWMPSRPARAAFPGANGKIAFSSNRSNTTQIYLLDPVTKAVVQLTDSRWPSGAPAWSPDGSRIAFLSLGDNGVPDVYVMNADGSAPTRLTNNTDGHADIESPSWSPDGSKLVFVRGDPDRPTSEQRDIYVMDADGTGEVNLTNHSADYFNPVWSPDGSKIAFSGNRDSPDPHRWDIELMNADGTNVVRLTHDGTDLRSAASWSPDGSHLAYDGPRNSVYIINADGSDARTITSTSADWNPDWSPDGSKLLFMHAGSDSPDPHDDIFIADLDGTHGRSLSRQSELGVDHEPHWQPFFPKPGDVNCSKAIDSIDAAATLQLSAALVPMLVCDQNADVNVDGHANSIDALLILQYTAGLLAHLPP